jgi:hypothetical protein
MEKEDYEKNNEIYQRIDDFIKQLHEKNIQLNHKAETIMITQTVGKETWGKPIKESVSLSSKIVEKMAHYQRIVASETMTEKMITEADGKEEDFVRVRRYIDLRSAIRNQKNYVSNGLFDYIEQAYAQNCIDEIALGKKLRMLEDENVDLKRKNATLQKLNYDLARENTDLHRLFPDAKTGLTGELHEQ